MSLHPHTLEVMNLNVALPRGQRLLRDVSLTLEPGEVRALVGESGAGKSMIGKAVLGILPPAVKVTDGEILLEGRNLGTLTDTTRRTTVAIMFCFVCPMVASSLLWGCIPGLGDDILGCTHQALPLVDM